ncbi:MAG: protein kinase [Planctomycetes bacterium]|nr:protein kinase [Planctomycetota bacterium]
MTTSRTLPDGFSALAVLREDAGRTVLHARGPSGDVLLRVGAPDGDGQGLTELAVLSEVRLAGLAPLAGFGQLGTSGELWIAREWVPGEDLATWAAGRAPREVAAVVASLCDTLHGLHARGFVHADLKPENVIVAPDGRPWLTDLGLARRSGSAGAAAGTPYYVAPEVLLGAAPGPAADLFALGVLLHALLVGRRAGAREFYARFPAHDFVAASETAPADLPEWARELVARLVERDPRRRPASAAALAADLRAALGGAAAAPPPAVPPGGLRAALVAAGGREAWSEQVLGGYPGVLACALPAGGEAGDVLEALRLAALLRGGGARVVRSDELAHPERLVRAVLDDARTLWLVDARDRDALEAAAYVARGLRAQPDDDVHAPRRWVTLVPADLAPPAEAFTLLPLPPSRRRRSRRVLAPDFEGDLDALASGAGRTQRPAASPARRACCATRCARASSCAARAVSCADPLRARCRRSSPPATKPSSTRTRGSCAARWACCAAPASWRSCAS